MLNGIISQRYGGSSYLERINHGIYGIHGKGEEKGELTTNGHEWVRMVTVRGSAQLEK